MGETVYKTQCEKVLAHLQKYGSITQNDCDEWRPKCKRLASRISDLEQKHNMVILRKRETQKDKNGKEICHWTRYYLPTEEQVKNGV